jgi:5-methylcytosine-specific restriction endonuclease McrA
VAISSEADIQVRERAAHCCEFVGDNGKRCGSIFFLQIEHIIPVACGGTNELLNLRLYCQAHNLLMAKKWGISDYFKLCRS